MYENNFIIFLNPFTQLCLFSSNFYDKKINDLILIFAQKPAQK